MSNKKIITASVGAFVIAAVLFFVARWLFSSHAVPTPAATTSVSQQIQQRVVEQQRLEGVIKEAQKTDKDLDGVPDSDETGKYHTDPALADTDGDGLTDQVEIFMYKTDPLKKDTYSLGHTDGWGVRHRVILPDGKLDRAMLSTQ